MFSLEILPFSMYAWMPDGCNSYKQKNHEKTQKPTPNSKVGTLQMKKL